MAKKDTKQLLFENMEKLNPDFKAQEDTSHTITPNDLATLKKINFSLPREEVLDWFNQNDVEYVGMSDIEMYIKYIEMHNSKSLQELNPNITNPTATQTTKQPAMGQQQAVNKQPYQPSDVKSLYNANKTATTVKTAGKRINTATEFPEAFRVWFATLGYKPNNPAISIMKVRTEVERVMRSMGYK